MSAFERAWCPFRWDEWPTARLQSARVFMTPDGAAQLLVPHTWWTSQVRPNRTVATCTGIQVFAPDAPSTGTRTVLRAVMRRTSRDLVTGRSATVVVTDQRWLVFSGGRWWVDVVTEGG